MISVNETPWNKMEPSARIAFFKDNADYILEKRRNFDYKWYLDKRFKAGDQHLDYNYATNTIERTVRSRGSVRMVINFVKSHTRAIQNFVVSSDPKAEVIPGDLDEETIKNAYRAGKMLDWLHRQKLFLSEKVRIAVDDIMDTTVSFFEYGWDKEADGGEGQVVVWTHDPFDIILPLTAYTDGPIIRSPFIMKVVPRSISEIRADEKYDEKSRMKVQVDTELAASQLKSRMLRKEGQSGDRREGQEMATIYEVKYWDYEKNEKGGNVNLYTFSKGGQELRNEETDMKEYPDLLLRDESRREVYGSCPTTYSLLHIQRGLNRLESQKLESNNILLKPRILAEKGHGINFKATGRTGTEVEVLEYNPGREVNWWNPPTLSDGGQSNRFVDYMRLVSGVTEAQMGINPPGGRSGDMLEALLAAGANNLAGFRMSLESFLPVLYSRVLDVVADNYVTSRVFKIAGEEKAYDTVIGRAGTEEGKEAPRKAAIINKDNEVVVTIGSWLGYSKEAIKKSLMELGDRGWIDSSTALKYLGIANVDEVAKRAREERLEEHELKAEIAGRREGAGPPAGPPAAGPPAPTGPGPELADEENARMMNGEQIPPTPGATPEHTQAHADYLQAPEAQENPEGMRLIMAHARGELQGGEMV